jgi:hypothetical protein
MQISTSVGVVQAMVFSIWFLGTAIRPHNHRYECIATPLAAQQRVQR